ncbi:DUF4191 family protein [Rhodococcus hoagii]|nr:DUF4191 family protein [Prescottella equi]
MANGSKSGKAGKPSKEAKAAAKAARKQASKERRTQLWQAFQMQRKEDKLLLPMMIGALVASALVFFLVGLIFGIEWFLLPIGVLVGVLLASSSSASGSRRRYTARPRAGRCGRVGTRELQGAWRVKNAVTGTAQLDAVHRDRPSRVILVAEGSPQRVKGLLAQEKKKTARLVGDTPIYDIVVGNDEGQVPLSQLVKYLNKLPRNIDTKRMDSIESRLAALGSRSGAAMPKVRCRPAHG